MRSGKSSKGRSWSNPMENFLRKVVEGPECYGWDGAKTRGGYAIFAWRGRKGLAHVFIYEETFGPVPEGWDVDHLCHTRECKLGDLCPHRACTRVDHLKAVPHKENVRRGRTGQHWREREHCKNGHPFDETNSMWTSAGWRLCRECHRQSARRAAQKQRDKVSMRLEQEFRDWVFQ